MEGRLISANAATEALSGYAVGELMGTRLTDYVLRSDVERIRRAVYAVATGRSDAFPAHMRHRDGRTVPVECNTFLARAPGGEVVGVFARLRDVADLRAAEERVTLNERAIEEQSERIRRRLPAASRGESNEQQIDNTLRLGWTSSVSIAPTSHATTASASSFATSSAKEAASSRARSFEPKRRSRGTSAARTRRCPFRISTSPMGSKSPRERRVRGALTSPSAWS